LQLEEEVLDGFLQTPGVIQSEALKEVVGGNTGIELPAHLGWLLGHCSLLFAWHGCHPIKAFWSAYAVVRCSPLPGQISPGRTHPPPIQAFFRSFVVGDL